MKLAIGKGLTISLIALTFALGLASCATDTPPPPPPPAPMPAPAGPPVALNSEISDAASVYVDYIATARAISADFKDGDSVQTELQMGATYEPKQLSRGAVAYGAIVAMQEPSFRAALRNYAANDASRADILGRILADPTYAAALPGADNAARRVILALSSDGETIYKSGSGVKQAAYDIQHQGWSKEVVNDRDGRLARAKQNSVTLASIQSDESAQLLSAALSGQGLVTKATTGSLAAPNASATNAAQGSSASVDGSGAQPVAADAAATPAADLIPDHTPPVDFDRPDLFNAPYTETVNHALAIAAIAILGEGADHANESVALLDVDDGPRCLGMSKLNLYECLSVAKPYYEDVFCLGQHALMDTGQCLGKVSSNALSFAPKQNIGFNDDGTVAHADAVAYLQPVKPVKCRKGHKCKAAASTTASSGKTASDKTTTPAKHSKKKKH